MILALAVITGLLALWLLGAGVLSFSKRIDIRQALLYAPLKAIFRIHDRDLVARAAETGTVFAVSHQSRLDPALMMSLLPDDTLHILDARSATSYWLEPWRELARTITFNPEHVFVSRRLVRLLRGGGKLAVYLPPETEPDAKTFRLYRAIARIADRAGAKVVAVHVAGARHSPFSQTPAEDAPRRLLPRMRIHALAAKTIPELRERIAGHTITASNGLFDRMAEARFEAANLSRSLFGALRNAADRLDGGGTIIEDSLGNDLTYHRLLIAVRALAARFAATTVPGETVGLLLPNAVPVATAFFALQSAGRIAAMLNYTAGPANLAAAIGIGRIGTVVSSRTFIEKAQLEDELRAIEAAGARVLWLEDLRDGISSADRLLAALMRRRALARVDPDQPAVMLFTSGSEGMPKGVLLSHRNLLANVAQVETRIAFSPRDSLFNVLPVFHSFGMTGGMILPLLSGVRLQFYPSPLYYRQIPEMVAKLKSTVLFGTDTFLAAYARQAGDGDFASLRLVIAGAEPVRAETRRVWRERFGIDIREGFGMTECSPVVAVNSATHDRHGTVGRPLPGIRLRLEPVEGLANGGRLHISGPNVMLGYVDRESPAGYAPPPGGWHDSGDIVSLDREGFLIVRGRARRFAKIAGEMVSLGAVEMLAASLWPEDKHAAVAVPDERKGERVVLVTTAPGAERTALRGHARKVGAGDLALPAEIVHVEELPVLGTGKTDYARVAQHARASLGIGEAAA